MNKRFSFLIIRLFFLLSATLVHAQNRQELKDQGLRNIFLEAESYFLFEEYGEAVELYLILFKEMPDNANISYKLGRCYLHDPYRKARSLTYLMKAAGNVSEKYKTNSFRETMAPLEAIYYLAEAYRVTNNLDRAIETYQKFLNQVDQKTYDLKLVHEQIEAVKRAQVFMTNPAVIEKTSISDAINNRFAQLNPVISGDGNTLVYTSKLQFYDAIYLSYRQKSGWTDPENLVPVLKVDGETFPVALSFDGTELYLYKSDNYDGNIYVSFYKNETWTEPEILNENINTKYWESHASLNKEGNMLYFTSNRPGGYGELDIYRSRRIGPTTWDIPQNMGPVINSRHNDDTPFITPDGGRLFFSSLGHNSMGGYDVFYSEKMTDGGWSEPVNPGYPFNTTDDELFFSPLGSGHSGFMSSFIPDNSRGLMDIYRVEIYSDENPRPIQLLGKLILPEWDFNDHNSLMVRILRSESNEIIAEQIVSSDTFDLPMFSGKSRVIITGKDILPFSEEIDIPVDQPGGVFTMDIQLEKAPVEEPSLALSSNQPEAKNNANAIDVPDEILWTKDEPVEFKFKTSPGTLIEVEIKNSAGTTKHQFLSDSIQFTYRFTPLPGENELKLKVTYPDNGSAEKTVRVIYEPPVIDALAAAESKADSADYMPSEKDVLMSILDELIKRADGALYKHLINIQSNLANHSSLKNAGDLYERLIEDTKNNLFTINEVDQLFLSYLGGLSVTYAIHQMQFVLPGVSLPDETDAVMGSSASSYISDAVQRLNSSARQTLLQGLIRLMLVSDQTFIDFIRWISPYLDDEQEKDLSERYGSLPKTPDLLRDFVFDIFNASGDRQQEALTTIYNSLLLNIYKASLQERSTDSLNNYFMELSLTDWPDPTMDALVSLLFSDAKKGIIHLGELLDLMEAVNKGESSETPALINTDILSQNDYSEGISAWEIGLVSGGFMIILLFLIMRRKKNNQKT